MKKIFIFIFISIIFFGSCRIDPVVPSEDLNNIVIINNTFGEMLLTSFTNAYSTTIYIENISAVLVIELEYTINDRDYLILKTIVPKEKLQLYRTGLDDMIITCTVNNIEIY